MGDARIYPTAPSVDQTPYLSSVFDFVSGLAKETVEQASHDTTCDDMSAGTSIASSLRVLRSVLGKDSIPICDDSDEALTFYQDYCGRPEHSQLRAVCPNTCGCSIVGMRNFA